MPTLEQLPKPEKPGSIIDFAGILQLLPHRYPFLFVDRITELVVGVEKPTIAGIKNITFNEPFFQGHFPSEPVMPGVIQIEAMAQVFCILMYLAYPDYCQGKRPAFMGVDECRFRKPVRPGDTLRIEATLERFRRGIGNVDARVLCEGEVVAEAKLTATMI